LIGSPGRESRANKGGNLRTKLLATLGAIAVLGVAALPVSAGASGGAKTTVTIKYNGDGFQGKVKSPREKCIKNRKVNVFKKNGQKLYSDTSDSDGLWSTGNSGQVSGSFYAHVNSSHGCKAATSTTIHT
jgi:hypothetical protein